MANLTPEQLAAYMAAINGGGASYEDPNGLSLTRLNNAGAPDWLEQMSMGGLGNMAVGNYEPGAQYDIYNAQGVDTGKDGQYSNSNIELEAAMALAALMGVGAAGGMFAGAGGTSAMGASGGGFGVAGDAYLPGLAAGDAYLPGAMSIGGSVGSAAPLAGLDGYLATGAAGAAGGAAGGAASGGGASAGGGLLSSLGGKGLGLAATALGGLAGGQGQDATASVDKRMDPRLDAAVYGENGLVPRTQGLLAAQMTPERMQGYLDMQNAGRGLLSQPIAGNGFSRLTGR